MNLEGRNWVGRSLVSRHSVHIYILSYSRLRKKEPLIAPGSHQGGEGGGRNVCVRGTSLWDVVPEHVIRDHNVGAGSRCHGASLPLSLTVPEGPWGTIDDLATSCPPSLSVCHSPL